jgi:hypothetical protein
MHRVQGGELLRAHAEQRHLQGVEIVGHGLPGAANASMISAWHRHRPAAVPLNVAGTQAAMRGRL